MEKERPHWPCIAAFLCVLAGAGGASIVNVVMHVARGYPHSLTFSTIQSLGQNSSFCGAVVAILPAGLIAWGEAKGSFRRFPWGWIGATFLLAGVFVLIVP